MPRVAVIGSNSFSGSHLIDLLLEDPAAVVAGISRSPEKHAMFLPYARHGAVRFQFHQLHMARDPEKCLAFFDAFEPEYVVNYAALNEIAPSHEHAADYFETNVVALAKIMIELRKRPYLKKYAHISTPEVYGNCEYPLSENAPYNPSTPYATSKASADMYLSTLFRNFDFPVVFTRATNYYGAGQQLWKILPKAAILWKRGEQLPLQGGGTALKTWIHVRDAARGVLVAMQKGMPGEVYHLSDRANVMTVRQALERLADAMGVRFFEVIAEAPARVGQDARYLLDYSKAECELGWSPKVSFQDGLHELVSWVEAHWADLKDQPLEYVHHS